MSVLGNKSQNFMKKKSESYEEKVFRKKSVLQVKVRIS